MVSDAIAAFAAGPISPPQKTLDVARHMIESTVVRALAQEHAEQVTIALDVALALKTPPHAAVLGRSERLSAQWAAFVNAMASRAAVVPAVLALAEPADARGRELVEAVIVGTEAGLRLAESVAPDHADRGWDTAGTIAHLSSVLAAGRLIGLDVSRMRNALGIAATQTAGLWAAFGTMTQSYHLAKASADGVEAALLAQAGFTGPAQPIEGRRGFAALLSRRFVPETVVRDLGKHYIMDHTTLDDGEKPDARAREVLRRYALA
ncbi:MAG TPA: MmgE/PrpD family protein [Candidatus Acidoferrales bacterium]|nr:MmgE/PrpD family protein [Candidatus Acidoferrales bacterium]